MHGRKTNDQMRKVFFRRAYVSRKARKKVDSPQSKSVILVDRKLFYKVFFCAASQWIIKYLLDSFRSKDPFVRQQEASQLFCYIFFSFEQKNWKSIDFPPPPSIPMEYILSMIDMPVCIPPNNLRKKVYFMNSMHNHVLLHHKINIIGSE